MNLETDCAQRRIMEPITIRELLDVTGGQLLNGSMESSIGSFSTDSRTIKPGEFFVPLQGRNYDGHAFIRQAVQKGARGFFATSLHDAFLKDGDTVVIYAHDTLTAYQDIAAAYRSRFDIPVVGITGSNGKTTTKELIRELASVRFNVLATEGTRNNHVGVPATLLNLLSEHDVAVLELGMSGLGEIKRLAEIASVNIGVLTNVAQTHLEYLESIENVAAGKRELVESLRGGDVAILNIDDPFVKGMDAVAAERVVTYGIENEADFQAQDIVFRGKTGSRFHLCIRHTGEKVSLDLPLPGRHNIYNALASIAACHEIGLTPDEITVCLSNVVLPPMRMEILTINGMEVVNDAYNANPSSAETAIAFLKELPSRGRKVLVMGDMLELGESARKAHREIGKRAAQEIDMLVVVGTYAEDMAHSARECGMAEGTVYICRDKKEAVQVLKNTCSPGDTILVKGSRGVRMEEVIELLGDAP